MAELAQAYIHLKPFSVLGDPGDFGDRVTREAAKAAREVYSFPVTLQVRIQEGSAKIWTTVIGPMMGSAMALYGAVAIYPDFKQGSAELYSDAREFGELAIENIKRNIKPPERAIYRAERRSRDAGRIFKLYQRLDKLYRSKESLSKSMYDDECARIIRELDRIISTFDTDEADFLRQQFRVHDQAIGEVAPPKRRRQSEHQIELMALADIATDDADKIIYRKSVVVWPEREGPKDEKLK